jgi:malonyl CoA-acyl carrier protein transacylase
MIEPFMNIVRREKWCDKDAVIIAAKRIDCLECALAEAIEYRGTLVQQIHEILERAKLAEYCENIAHERISDRDVKITELEETLAACVLAALAAERRSP